MYQTGNNFVADTRNMLTARATCCPGVNAALDSENIQRNKRVTGPGYPFKYRTLFEYPGFKISENPGTNRETKSLELF